MAFNGIVPAPRVEPALFGLLSVAQVINHGASDEHWVGGLSWLSELCSYDVRVINVCGPDDIDLIESTDADPGATPGFAIDVTDVCTTTFGMDSADRAARLDRAVDSVSGIAVERVLWSGLDVATGTWGAVNDHTPSLVDSGAVVVGSGALDPLEAVAALEKAVAEDHGIRATFHMDRQVATMVAENYVVTPDQKVLTTKLGSKIAAGSGYGGEGPTGQTSTAGQGWIYATGPVVVHLGPVITYEVPDERKNDIFMRAERPAAIAWDRCMLYAVKVTL